MAASLQNFCHYAPSAFPVILSPMLTEPRCPTLQAKDRLPSASQIARWTKTRWTDGLESPPLPPPLPLLTSSYLLQQFPFQKSFFSRRQPAKRRRQKEGDEDSDGMRFCTREKNKRLELHLVVFRSQVFSSSRMFFLLRFAKHIGKLFDSSFSSLISLFVQHGYFQRAFYV